jgi:UDP-2,4-diacetamido-2,4,6-trideoxy-beta-L-altropyranose hydrolase
MIEPKSIYFIVNANNKIGAGHLKRCISLANKLVNHDEINKIIFTGWITDAFLIKDLHFPYLKLKKSEIISEFKFCNTKKGVKNYLIIDSDDKDLHRTNFQELCNKNNFTTVYFTVNKDFYYKCDFLINPNILALYQDYKISKKTRKLFGPNFFVFNKYFEGIDINPRKKFSNSIFINFGNADPRNISYLLLECLTKVETLRQTEIHLVIGNLVKNKELIQDIVKLSKFKIKLYTNLNDIKSVMAKCQLAICSLGTTFWELAVMGIPSIIIPSSYREEETSKILNKLGYAQNLFIEHKFFDSNTQNKLEYLITNSNSLIPNFKKLQKTINTNGVDKLIYEILILKNRNE